MSEECANPLLLGWIKEWLDQARERNNQGFTVLETTRFYIIDFADLSTATRKPMIL